MPEYRTPAQLLEAHLKERGWTQRVLALVLRVDETTVSKIFTGKKDIDAQSIDRRLGKDASGSAIGV